MHELGERGEGKKRRFMRIREELANVVGFGFARRCCMETSDFGRILNGNYNGNVVSGGEGKDARLVEVEFKRYKINSRLRWRAKCDIVIHGCGIRRQSRAPRRQ